MNAIIERKPIELPVLHNLIMLLVHIKMYI